MVTWPKDFWTRAVLKGLCTLGFMLLVAWLLAGPLGTGGGFWTAVGIVLIGLWFEDFLREFDERGAWVIVPAAVVVGVYWVIATNLWPLVMGYFLLMMGIAAVLLALRILQAMGMFPRLVHG